MKDATTYISVHDASAEEYTELFMHYPEQESGGTRWIRLDLGSTEVTVFRPDEVR